MITKEEFEQSVLTVSKMDSIDLSACTLCPACLMVGVQVLATCERHKPVKRHEWLARIDTDRAYEWWKTAESPRVEDLRQFYVGTDHLN